MERRHLGGIVAHVAGREEKTASRLLAVWKDNHNDRILSWKTISAEIVWRKY
jgi:hypothetical protein